MDDEDRAWMAYLSSDDSMLGEDDPHIPDDDDAGRTPPTHPPGIEPGTPHAPTDTPTATPHLPTATSPRDSTSDAMTAISTRPTCDDASPADDPEHTRRRRLSIDSQCSQASRGSQVAGGARPRVSFMRRTTTGLRAGENAPGGRAGRGNGNGDLKSAGGGVPTRAEGRVRRRREAQERKGRASTHDMNVTYIPAGRPGSRGDPLVYDPLKDPHLAHVISEEKAREIRERRKVWVLESRKMSTSGTVTRDDRFLSLGLGALQPTTTAPGGGRAGPPTPFACAAEDVSMYSRAHSRDKPFPGDTIYVHDGLEHRRSRHTARVMRVYLSQIEGNVYTDGGKRFVSAANPEEFSAVATAVVAAVRSVCRAYRVRASVHWPLTGLSFGDETPAEALYLACRGVENADVYVAWEHIRRDTGDDGDANGNDAGAGGNYSSKNQRTNGNPDGMASVGTAGPGAAGGGSHRVHAKHEAYNVAARVYPAVRPVINRPWGEVEAAIAASDDGARLVSKARYLVVEDESSDADGGGNGDDRPTSPASNDNDNDNDTEGYGGLVLCDADESHLEVLERIMIPTAVAGSEGEQSQQQQQQQQQQSPHAGPKQRSAAPIWLDRLVERVAEQMHAAIAGMFPGSAPVDAPPIPTMTSAAENAPFPATYHQRQLARLAQLSRWYVYRASYARALIDPLLPFVTRLPASSRAMLVTGQRGGGKSTTLAGWYSRHVELQARAHGIEPEGADQDRSPYRQPISPEEVEVHEGHLVLCHLTVTSDRPPRLSEVLTYFLQRLLAIEANVVGPRTPAPILDEGLPPDLPRLLFDTAPPPPSRRLVDEFRAACYRTAKRLAKRPHAPWDAPDPDNNTASGGARGGGTTGGRPRHLVLLVDDLDLLDYDCGTPSTPDAFDPTKLCGNIVLIGTAAVAARVFSGDTGGSSRGARGTPRERQSTAGSSGGAKRQQGSQQPQSSRRSQQPSEQRQQSQLQHQQATAPTMRVRSFCKREMRLLCEGEMVHRGMAFDEQAFRGVARVPGVSNPSVLVAVAAEVAECGLYYEDVEDTVSRLEAAAVRAVQASTRDTGGDTSSNGGGAAAKDPSSSSTSGMPEHMRALAAVMADVFQRIERQVSRTLVQRIMSLMWAVEDGMTEDEIIAAVCSGDSPLAEQRAGKNAARGDGDGTAPGRTVSTSTAIALASEMSRVRLQTLPLMSMFPPPLMLTPPLRPSIERRYAQSLGVQALAMLEGGGLPQICALARMRLTLRREKGGATQATGASRDGTVSRGQSSAAGISGGRYNHNDDGDLMDTDDELMCVPPIASSDNEVQHDNSPPGAGAGGHGNGDAKPTVTFGDQPHGKGKRVPRGTGAYLAAEAPASAFDAPAASMTRRFSSANAGIPGGGDDDSSTRRGSDADIDRGVKRKPLPQDDAAPATRPGRSASGPGGTGTGGGDGTQGGGGNPGNQPAGQQGGAIQQQHSPADDTEGEGGSSAPASNDPVTMFINGYISNPSRLPALVEGGQLPLVMETLEVCGDLAEPAGGTGKGANRRNPPRGRGGGGADANMDSDDDIASVISSDLGGGGGGGASTGAPASSAAPLGASLLMWESIDRRMQIEGLTAIEVLPEFTAASILSLTCGDYDGSLSHLAAIARATAKSLQFDDREGDRITGGDPEWPDGYDTGVDADRDNNKRYGNDSADDDNDNNDNDNGMSILPLMHVAARVLIADTRLRLGHVRTAVDDLHEAMSLCELRTQWALTHAERNPRFASFGAHAIGDGFDDAGDGGTSRISVEADPHGVWFAYVHAKAMLLFALVQRRNGGYDRASLVASDALRVLDTAAGAGAFSSAAEDSIAADPPLLLMLRIDLLDCLGGCLLKRSLGTRSIAVLREALSIARRVYGPAHPVTARTLASVSLAHRASGMLKSSLSFAVDARGIYAATMGGGAKETKAMEELIVRLDTLIHERSRAKSSFFQPKLPSGKRSIVGGEHVEIQQERIKQRRERVQREQEQAVKTGGASAKAASMGSPASTSTPRPPGGSAKGARTPNTGTGRHRHHHHHHSSPSPGAPRHNTSTIARRIRFTADGKEIFGDDEGETEDVDPDGGGGAGGDDGAHHLPPIAGGSGTTSAPLSPKPVSTVIALQPHTAPGDRPDGDYPVVLRPGLASVELFAPKPPPLPPIEKPPTPPERSIGVGTRKTPPPPEAPPPALERLSKPAQRPPCRMVVTGQGKAVKGPMSFIVTVEMGSVGRGSRIYLRDGTLAGTVHRMTNNIGEPLSSLIKGDKGVHIILAKVSGLSAKIVFGMTVHKGDTLHALGEK